ncbi:hypothetical protein [Stenotrophomonas sp.]|uniref:hypothetical protein n=1 Tax=Stenotrophomonas sp. TaxID=69392 RepID=UPI0029B943E0|nr:hypothetical protein [Stenotrophomonas sp.]MDX3935200.1 hypothetical protein [Stenotrophomonas sp.]
MTAQFEDALARAQKGLIELCLEYAEADVSDIYAYCVMENQIFSFDVFYGILGNLYHKHELNRSRPASQPCVYDTSPDRQCAMLETGIAEIKVIAAMFSKYGNACPTDIRMHYRAADGRLSSDFQYSPMFTDHPTLTSEDIFDGWFDQVKFQASATATPSEY